ncbi:MAG TPA: DUF4149 domain-containing protein [Pyrinomonadaceae bacterium]|nr:DUF4149 domain-containing protein [Pyrinomonadaceae bacterium]
MRTVVGYLRPLLLGLWLGAALFFGAAVAPTVFGVLRGAQLSNAGELAGMMVQRLLSVINRGGFEISLFLLVTGFFMSKKQSRLVRSAEMISLAIMAIMTGVSHWIISARMLALKTAMQAPIDQIAGNDPRRIAFDALHGYSVAAMGVAMAAALLAFFVIGIQSRQRS